MVAVNWQSKPKDSSPTHAGNSNKSLLHKHIDCTLTAHCKAEYFTKCRTLLTTVDNVTPQRLLGRVSKNPSLDIPSCLRSATSIRDTVVCSLISLVWQSSLHFHKPRSGDNKTKHLSPMAQLFTTSPKFLQGSHS